MRFFKLALMLLGILQPAVLFGVQQDEEVEVASPCDPDDVVAWYMAEGFPIDADGPDSVSGCEDEEILSILRERGLLNDECASVSTICNGM